MRDVAAIVVPWAFLTLALFALLDWDESRLAREPRDRAWPPATRTLALVYFGLLSLPVHFWRTRRTALGVLLGFAWAAAALGVDWVFSELVDALPEWALGGAMALSLTTFTAAMIWRSRAGPWWYQSARDH
jgi:hypothetical protein